MFSQIRIEHMRVGVCERTNENLQKQKHNDDDDDEE